MDAATLYLVVTLPNGEQRTSKQEFPSLKTCEAQIETLQMMKGADRQSPITSFRCEEDKPLFYLIACDWSGKWCNRLGPLSRQGCTAQQWLTRLPGRSFAKLARCYRQHDR